MLSMAIEHLCKNCGRSFVRFNNLQTRCNLCAFNRYAKPKKQMKRIGKVTQQWIDTRKAWIAAHPSKDGIWLCYICDKELTIDTMTLDHIIARTRDQSLRFVHDNLAPCCWKDNEAKGSLSLEEYARKR